MSRYNISRDIGQVGHWRVHSEDVLAVDWKSFKGDAEFVAGRPTCQPFSIGGLHKGEEDARDMWPEAVREIRPNASC